MQLLRVLPQTLPAAWYTVGPMLMRAVETSVGDLDMWDYYKAVLEQTKQLWVVEEDRKILAAVVTSFGLGQCTIELLAGDGYDAWGHLRKEIEQWALEMGCTEIIAWVRPGLERALRREGFRSKKVIVSKVLRG